MNAIRLFLFSRLAAGLALVTLGSGISTLRAQNAADEVAQRLSEQQQPRKVVPFDAKQFDHFVGFYQLQPDVFFTVTRKGDHFFSRLTGQPAFEVYPESPTKFFLTVVAAQISFVTNAEGNANELVLHQNGAEQHAPKVDEAVVKAAEVALADRIKNKTADPERLVPLRRYVDMLVKGQPDLDDMGPALVAATQKQWPKIQENFGALGALQSLVFERVNPMGFDVYLGTFANQSVEFLIGPLSSDHKMQGLLMRPAS